MKIAFIAHPLDAVKPPLQSSMGIIICALASRLAKRHQVSVYLRGSRRKKTEQLKGLTYHHVPTLWDKLLLSVFQPVLEKFYPDHKLFSYQIYYLFYILQVALELRKGQYDAVYLLNYTQFVPVIRLLNPKIRLALHMQGEWLSQLDRKQMLKRTRKADLIMGVSDYITRKIIDRLPELKEKCITLFNGVDAEHFAEDAVPAPIPDKPKLAVFVGRVSPEKGVHILVDAFNKVLQKHPNCLLKIVGPEWIVPKKYIVALSEEQNVAELASFFDRSYVEQLKERIKPEFKDKIVFTGHVPLKDLRSYYAEADILVNPSFSESFGMTLVEAMASEVPVVATSVGGMTEIVEDGETGFLVAPGDVDGLADAMGKLLGNEKLLNAMKKPARARAVNFFSWDKQAARLEQCYRELLSTKSTMKNSNKEPAIHKQASIMAA